MGLEMAGGASLLGFPTISLGLPFILVRATTPFPSVLGLSSVSRCPPGPGLAKTLVWKLSVVGEPEVPWGEAPSRARVGRGRPELENPVWQLLASAALTAAATP